MREVTNCVDEKLLCTVATCADIFMGRVPCVDNISDLQEVYEKVSAVADVNISYPKIVDRDLYFVCHGANKDVTITITTGAELIQVTDVENMIADVYEAMQEGDVSTAVFNDLSCIVDEVVVDLSKVRQIFNTRGIDVNALALKYFTQERIIDGIAAFGELKKNGSEHRSYSYDSAIFSISKLLSDISDEADGGITNFEKTLLSVDRGVVAGEAALIKHGLLRSHSTISVEIWTDRKELHDFQIGRFTLWYNPYVNRSTDPSGELIYESAKDTVAQVVYFSDYMYTDTVREALERYARTL